MSTMSELHRLMQEIKADDLDILADIAYQQENAMREEMDEPEHFEGTGNRSCRSTNNSLTTTQRHSFETEANS